MAPLAPQKSINMGNISTASLITNNPGIAQPATRKPVAFAIDPQELIKPVIPVKQVIKTPQQMMKPMSQELPVSNPRTLPNGQPILAGNISPQSLQKTEIKYLSKADLKKKLIDYGVPQEEWGATIDALYNKGYKIEGYDPMAGKITQAPVPVAPQISYGENKLQDQNKSIKGSVAPQGPFSRIDPVRQDMSAGGLDYVGGHIKNWGTSLYNILPDLGNAAANPKQTVKGIGNALLGTLVNIGDKVGEVTGAGKLTDSMAMLGLSDTKVGDIVRTSDMTADQLGQMLADRYGGVDKLSKTAYEDPTGVLSDALTIIGGAGVALKGATFGSKVGTAGKVGRVADDLIKVGALDPYNLATEGAIKGAVGATKLAGKGVQLAGQAGIELLGKATGTSADTIKEIYRTAGSKGTTDAMRGLVTDENILKSVTDGLEEIKDQRRIIYGNDYEILKNSSKQINTSGIKNKFTNELLDGLNIKVVEGGLDFSQSKVTSSKSQANIVDMYNDISKWTDNSPAGIDILKQRVSDYWGGTPETAKADRLSTMLSNDLKGLVVKEVPEYARMMTKYEDLSNLIKDIKQTLSVGGKASTSTAITKLKGALRQNQEFRQTMIKQIEKYSGDNIMGQLAGSQMNALMPRGLAGVGAGVVGLGIGYLLDPTFIGGLIATSPRIVGEVANALGIGAKKVQSYVDNIKKMIPSKGVVEKGQVMKALPQEAKSNIGTKKNPIVSRVRDVKVIEKGVATKPGTTKDIVAKLDQQIRAKKQGETPVKTVPRATETKIEPKNLDNIPDKKTIAYYDNINKQWGDLKDQDFRNNVETLKYDEFENMSPILRKRYDKLLENEILQSDDFNRNLSKLSKEVQNIEEIEKRIGKVGKNTVIEKSYIRQQESERIRKKEKLIERISEETGLDQFEASNLYDDLIDYDNTATTQGKTTKSIITQKEKGVTEKVNQELQNIAKKVKEKSIAKKENGSIMDGMKTTIAPVNYDIQAIAHKSDKNGTIYMKANELNNEIFESKGKVSKQTIDINDLPKTRSDVDLKNVTRGNVDGKFPAPIIKKTTLNGKTEYTILDGNHRIEYFRKEGYKKVPVEVIELSPKSDTINPKDIVPKSKVVPKDLKPLYDEAKRYKSADEFVNKTTDFERGGDIRVSRGEAGEGIYMYPKGEKGFRDYYISEKDPLYHGRINKGAKIEDLTNKKQDIKDYLNYYFGEMLQSQKGYIKPKVTDNNRWTFGDGIDSYIKQRGLTADGYIFPHKGQGLPTGKQIVIKNKDAIKFTKNSELRKIREEANK